MDELKWELLTEVQGRLEADLLKSYFEAYGIDIELFQESVGQHIFPTTLDMLGRVQIFAAKKDSKVAGKLLKEYYTPTKLKEVKGIAERKPHSVRTSRGRSVKTKIKGKK